MKDQKVIVKRRKITNSDEMEDDSKEVLDTSMQTLSIILRLVNQLYA